MESLPDIVRQFITFCGVGAINTAVGLAIILGLSFAGAHYMLANAAGYGVGLCIGFVLHKKISFRDDKAFSHSLGQMRDFLIVFACAYAVQFFCLYVMVDNWGMSEIISQIIAIGIYTVISYAGNRLLTFKKTEGNSE